MIDGARQLPVQHITIRVPWHDNGWNGTFCNSPCANTSCTVLPRISSGRKDDFEEEHAGESLEELSTVDLPPCVEEHGTFMAPFSMTLEKKHPYADAATQTHGHFAKTSYHIPPYSIAAIPFRWMLREEVEGNAPTSTDGKAELLKLGYETKREPDLSVNKGWKKGDQTWVQEGTNQLILLDTFFSALETDKSLIFFYAKRTPLVDDSRRVIVGVGRVKSVGGEREYRYEGGRKAKDKISGYLWERNVEHSIRPGKLDGFILPYQDLLESALIDEAIDLESCTAFAPDEYFENYSYGSELLPDDGAIASLLSLEKAIKHIREHIEAPWDEYLTWIDGELNRLWEIRGPFPGLGAALNAFGVPNGNLLAWHLTTAKTFDTNPWKKFEEVLDNPHELPDYIRTGLGQVLRNKWKKLPDERRALLKLLARFNLNNSQAERWYQPTTRKAFSIAALDSQILENPYTIYEEDRYQSDPICFSVIDRGVFPPEPLRQRSPVPAPSHVEEGVDSRRVRAAIIETLEEAAEQGHTILPEDWLVEAVRNRPMKPACMLDSDVTRTVSHELSPFITSVDLDDDRKAFQLDRYVETANLISKTIRKRQQGKRHSGEHDWKGLVKAAIDSSKQTMVDEVIDTRARDEKTAALEELFRARVSVLVGGAGTGKSTLLKSLCSIREVEQGGILLLAPTGKARVRLEHASGRIGEGQTIAQFLHTRERYDGLTGRYYLNEDAVRTSTYKTIIIDESSMLTEEQLAALLDALRGVDRLVLVGDHKQLPPIGAGRPYADIVNFLCPANIESMFPRVTKGYAELTVTVRQRGDNDDVIFANLFNGRKQRAGSDEVWHVVAAGKSANIETLRWDQASELQGLLLAQLTKELDLETREDEESFERSIGGTISTYNDRNYVFFNTEHHDRKGHIRVGAARSAEEWQILSPIRSGLTGVLSINRAIQQQFRKNFLDLASNPVRRKIILKPLGPDGIIYGDKVINVINKKGRAVYPKKEKSYVANGDIGIVTGHRRTKGRNWKPFQLEVEFSSQIGHSYKYWPSEFDRQEGTPPLELAYALTVHKAQGSEFNKTIIVLPYPCRPLSREMLYTALTRHRGKLILLHQGEFRGLHQYSCEEASEISRRMTNLFHPAKPVEVRFRNRSVFLDSNLIYRTERGELVRSKSEWIIADKLYARGIEYQYEQAVMLDGIERFPDFTIVDDDSGERWYWEHNGLLDDIQYRERWERKLKAYRKSGILPFEEGRGENGTLLVSSERQGKGLDANEIDENISRIWSK